MKSKNQNNILIVDNETPQITYNKSSVDNTYEYMPALDELVNDFNEKHDNIFSLNTDKCIRLILADGQELPLYKYKPEMTVYFLKIMNHDLSMQDSDIIMPTIGVLYNKPKKVVWQLIDPYKDSTIGKVFDIHMPWEDKLEKYTKDLNGYQNCQELLASAKNKGFKLDAIEYCQGLSTQIGNIKYAGYLPTYGQWIMINKYLKLINYILDSIGCEQLNICNTKWHTSTEIGSESVLSLRNGDPYGIYKFYDYKAFPLFKQIID